MKSMASAACVVIASLHLSGAAAKAASYTYATFDAPGAASTLAFGINDAGEIVGGNGKVGYVKSNGAFAEIAVPGARSTQAYGINAAGQCVGFYSDGHGLHGFVKSVGGYERISHQGSDTTLSFGINNKGRIVGTYTTAEGEYGYSYADGTFITIAVPGAVLGKAKGTQVHGINDLGQVVGFFNKGVDPSTGKNRIGGFVDKGGVIETFDAPGAYATEAAGINDAGQIVGTYGNGRGGFGFVYADGVFTTLAVPGASKTEAQGINNAGQVVGWEETEGKRHGFIATPVPESSQTFGAPKAVQKAVGGAAR